MADQNNALIVGIAQIIDYPSVYMGGPSRNSLRIAETIVKEFGADLARADRAAPEGQVRTQIANLSVWAGKAHPDQQLVDLSHVLAILDAASTDNTALVEAEKRGMQKVLSHFRECAEHDQGGLDYSSLVGIPICNADELASEVAFYERAARHVQDVLDRAALASREAPPAAQTDVQFGRQHFEPKRESDNQPYPACQQEAVTVAEDDILADAEAAYWADPNNDSFDRHCIRATLRALKGDKSADHT